MGCRHSKASDAVVSLTARGAQHESHRDDVTSDLIQHTYVNDVSEFFDIRSTIGTGHCGCVKYAVSKRSGQAWAVKVAALSNRGDRDALWHERSMLKRLHHPQIVPLLGSFEDKDQLYLVTQLCHGKDLYEHVYRAHRTFTESDVRTVIRALLRALVYLHARSITHRDLKLENLVLADAADPGSIRLCNFGLSTHFQRREKLIEPVGTIDYVAPEVLDGDYNEKCDLWSVGVICFELLTGVSPFHGATIDDTMENIYDGVLVFETDLWAKFSPSAVLFIQSLVKEDVDERLSAKQALASYWLNEEELTHVDSPRRARLQSDQRLLLANMRRFSTYRKMKQTALLAIALGIADNHVQQQVAAQVFGAIDRTRTGSLSRPDFRSALLESGLLDADADTLFQQVNQSKSGRMNFLEFMAATIDERDVSLPTIKEAFGLLDSTNQGRLSTSGLQNVFRHSMDAQELSDLIASIDSKDEGYVDFEAFQGLFAAAATETLELQRTEEEVDALAVKTHATPGGVEKPISKSHSFNTGTESMTDSSIASSTPSVTSYYESGLTLAARHEPIVVGRT
ncbi:unnamed protein product [Hyaloperonospora brassicae]|uniref:Calmodulin n=1 Tax=Hyaloperonospora brassicae TaxID=162125 RepID=A0AAV0TZC8_HYABA|nr:unnamed protein product [Hyaloperonospora brassicae]CAI5730575.1 unnamed protein product [Hyaloperonospora brassicae]